jgi:hypothetical protein
MKRTLVFCITLCFLLNIRAQSSGFIPIDQLVKQQQLTVDLIGLGGYQEECVELTVKNLSTIDQYVLLEAGRRLDNTDPKQQDILVVREKQFIVKGGQTISFNAFGFCCQASNGSPRTNVKFGLGTMATGNLLWIAQYLNKYPYNYNPGLMQTAVWIFSDSRNPASINCLNDTVAARLRRDVSTQLGITMPWYDIYYENDTSMVATHRHYNLVGPVTYKLPNRGWLDMVVRDPHKRMAHKFSERAFVEGGTYTYNVDLNVKGWIRGTYEIEIYLDDILKKKVSFIL